MLWVATGRWRGRGSFRTAATALLLIAVWLPACTSEPSAPVSTQRFKIPSRSMEPTLMEGAVVPVDTAALGSRGARAGELVVFEKPGCGVFEEAPESDCFEVKRVIGLGGETVRVSERGVAVNGEILEEPYIAPGGAGPTGKWVVEPGRVFVLGDNRSLSNDSRSYGSIPATSLYGLVVAASVDTGDSIP